MGYSRAQPQAWRPRNQTACGQGWGIRPSSLMPHPQTLVLPELRKSIRRKRSVSGRRLQIPMPEIMRKRPSILALVRKLVARRMSQHVGMNWEGKLRCLARTLDHSQEPRRRYWRS